MPSKSEQQRKYIFYLRGKYKNKSDTPEDKKWIWDDNWTKIKKEESKMSTYNRFFKEDDQEENSLSELIDISIPQKLVDFIKKHPFPKDHETIHVFAEGLGLDPDILEQYAYAFLTVMLTGGKSKGDASDISQEQLDIGMQIEKEHTAVETDNVVVKAIEDILTLKIVSDHNTEDKNYYSKSINFKDELKQENK